MLQLLLFRHAKSDWTVASRGDFDRPLAERGRRDAPRMGAYMREHAIMPDLVLCSTARRTRETLDLLLVDLTPAAVKLRSAPPRVDFEEALYLAESFDLLDRVRMVPRGVARVMLVGHNPGMHELAMDLAGAGARADRTHLAGKFPTAALAVITFEVADWSEVALARGRLERFVTPRELPGTS